MRLRWAVGAARRGAFSENDATRQPVVANSPSGAAALGAGLIPGTDASRRIDGLGADPRQRPGSRIIVLEDYQREDAFGEAEVRLLTTVAASMGVALENARLFDETQRLLKETSSATPSCDHQQRAGRGWRPSSTSRGSTTSSATRSGRFSTLADMRNLHRMTRKTDMIQTHTT